MARFKSPLKRAAALATVAIAALVGKQTANAQNATGSPIYGFDARTNDLAHSGDRSGGTTGSSGATAGSAGTPGLAQKYLDEYHARIAAEAANKSPTKQIIIDTPENRQFANRIYATAFAGIDKILKNKGSAAALEYSQHPEQNPALMALVKQAREGQYILATTILSDTMADAAAYINAIKGMSIPTLCNARWTQAASSSQDLIDQRGNGTELGFLIVMYQTPNYFGPKTQAAASLIISINKPAPVQTASLIR